MPSNGPLSLVLLSGLVFTSTGLAADPPAKPKEKPDPQLERLADAVILELLFKKNVESHARDRIASFEESLDLKIARCTMIAYVGVEPKLRDELMSKKLELVPEGLKLQAELAGLVVSRRATAAVAEEKAGATKAAREWELKYHAELKADGAAELVRLATSLGKAKPKEFGPVRDQYQSDLKKALAMDEASAKVLLKAPAEPEDVRKAREAARAALDKAK